MIKKITAFMLILAISFKAFALTGFESLIAAANGGGSGAETTIQLIRAAPAGSASPVSVGLGALALGTAVGYFGLNYLASGTEGNTQLRIPASNQPSKQIPKPAAPSAGVVGHTCQMKAGADTFSGDSGCPYIGTRWVTNQSGGGCMVHQQRNYPNAGAAGGCENYSATSHYYEFLDSYNQYSQEVPTCSAGYVVSGSGCALQNSRQVTADGNKDVSASGNSYGYPDDLDNIPASDDRTMNSSRLMESGYVIGNDGKKYPMYVDTFKRNDDPNNDSYIMRVSWLDYINEKNGIPSQVQNYNTATVGVTNGIVTNVSQTQTLGYAPSTTTYYTDPQGNVTQVQPGELVVTQPPAINTTTQTTPTAQIYNPITQPNPFIPAEQQTSGGTTTINLPTDYARQGEAQTAADTITDKLKEGEEEETPDLEGALPANPLLSVFNPLRSWGVPSQMGVCPFGSFDYEGHNYSFAVGCNLIESNLSLIQGVMSVIYILSALFIVLGA